MLRAVRKMPTYHGSFMVWLQHRTPGTLSPQDVAHFVRQAANDLQQAHNLGIVHGNVNPESFLTRANSEHSDLPDILLAERQSNAASGTSTTNQAIPNYPTYRSPEQWHSTTVPASDQYALAVLAYQLLTWRFPFLGTQEQMMHQHLYVQPQPPSMFNPHIPPSLNGVLLRALAKRPEERFPSIVAFANAFQQALQSPSLTPMQAQSASIPNLSNATRFKRLSRSSQIKELLILGVVFLVVMSSIGFGFFSIVKNNQASLVNLNATASTISQAPTFTNNTLIFSDPLSKNTNSRWEERSTCVFSGGTYHVLVQNQVDHRSFCGLNKDIFDNFAMQVDISLLSGYDVGMLFRFDSGNYYNFGLTSQGTFFFFRFHGGAQASMLIPFTASSVIAPGNQKNTLLIIAKGADFKLYINDVLVGEVEDSNISRGIMGFETGTSSTTSEADASFSNFRVYQM